MSDPWLRLTARIERSLARLAQSDARRAMAQRLLAALTPRRIEHRWLRDNWQQQRRQR
jgi:hypothetical protein